MEEKREFNSFVRHCIIIGAQQMWDGPLCEEPDEIVRAHANFYFPKEYPGLCEVKLEGFLICHLSKLDIETLHFVSKSFMRVSLSKVLKYWIKAWWR